jgi:hypothetical protein
MIDEHVTNQDWVDANKEIIASWSVFHLIWSINHDLSLCSVNPYPHIRKHGVTGAEQEKLLLNLEFRSEQIGESYEYLQDRYVLYHFARLSHERAAEQGEAFASALDAISKLHKCLRMNVSKIDEIGKEFLQDKYEFVSKEQRNLLEVAISINRGLSTILSVIDIWISARGLDN